MTSHLSPADRAELNRIWSELAAAQRIIERLLGDDDPMLYDRSDDEEPVAAPTRPHDGFHVTGRTQRPTNSPAGYASTERRTPLVNGRPGANLPEGFPASGMGEGAAVLRGAAVPARGGVR